MSDKWLQEHARLWLEKRLRRQPSSRSAVDGARPTSPLSQASRQHHRATPTSIGLALLLSTCSLLQWVGCNPLIGSPYQHAMPFYALSPMGAFGPSPMLYPAGSDLFAGASSGQMYPAGAAGQPFMVGAAGLNSFLGLPGPLNPFENNRRSVIGSPKSSGRDTKKTQGAGDESDEQKALGDIPLSLIEPEPPSSITERISESFSALGEGVKNHFRSMSENFSDTMDDIKDAWRPASSRSDSEPANKRRG